MSYLDRTADPNRRTTAITGVIAIHALLAYLLVTGLVYTRGPRERTPFAGEQFPLPPPPSPTPQPKETAKPKTANETPTVPQPKVDLTQTDHDTVVDKTDHVDVIPTATPSYAPYTPPPPPRFKPKGASPKNSPGGWAVTDDYPARDLREGNEGVTVFRAAIGTNGRVSACEIVKSSGHPGLDAATCKAVKARARFAPATDENGEPVAGTYSNSVLWQIPR